MESIEKQRSGLHIKCDLCEEIKIRMSNEGQILTGERIVFGKNKVKKNICDECLIDISEHIMEFEEE